MNKKIIKKIKTIKKFFLNIYKIIKIIFKSSKILTLLLFILTVIEGLILPLNMVISKFLIDSVANSLSNNIENITNQVFMWLCIEFLISIIYLILIQLRKYVYNYQSKLLNINITSLLLNKVTELDIEYFEDDKFYDNIEKANNESISKAYELLDTIIQTIRDCVTLLGSMAIVFSLKPIILVILFLVSIPTFLIDIHLSTKIYDIFDKRIQEKRFAKHLKNMLINNNNVKEIKINRLGQYLKDSILSIHSTHLNQDKKIGIIQMKTFSLIGIVNNIISYSFKLYVILRTIKNRLTLGSMTMYMSAIMNVDQSIRNIMDSIEILYTNNLYIDNLFTVLDYKPKIDINSNLPKFNGNLVSSIEFKNVSFKYPHTNKYSLKNINLTINAKETCAIVGLNGSGKTTLVKLLARLYDPTEGNIYIDGKDIREYNPESIYKSISVVFQDFMKYPFSVKDNIGFGNIDKIEDIDLIKFAANKSQASHFIEKLENKYDTKLEKLWTGGTDLSLGQWQKLAISRIFMDETAITILDEPTASLDAQAEYELFQHFKEIMSNTTCVLISHRLSSVKMADEIFVMKDGCIVEYGNHKNLMNNNGLYSELFNMQAQGYSIEKEKFATST